MHCLVDLFPQRYHTLHVSLRYVDQSHYILLFSLYLVYNRLGRTGYEPWVLTRQNPNRRHPDAKHSYKRSWTSLMGKYNHICELTGTENYAQWRRQVTLALKGEHLWNHCSSGTDLKDFAEVATTKPEPKDPAAITDMEKEKIFDWLAKDTQAKVLIDRKISSVIANQLNESQTAREQWEILSKRYLCTNLLSQYELRAHICSEKLKDTDDVLWYLGIFEDARRHFIQIGVSYSNDEAIFDLL